MNAKTLVERGSWVREHAQVAETRGFGAGGSSALARANDLTKDGRGKRESGYTVGRVGANIEDYGLQGNDRPERTHRESL